MQSDPIIWQVINNQFCSFKVILRDQNARFCRNQYNVTGSCDRRSCPLANSRYATVREENGVIYLYMKTIERAHSPKNLWEKIELQHTYTGALGQIDEHLMHWPTNQVHRVKQRLTRLHQYLIRMKKLLAKPSVKVSQVKKKYLARENAREHKALVAARLDVAIKKELLTRLKNKTYGDLYSVRENVFNEVLDQEGEDEVTFEFVADEDLDEELEKESEDNDIEDEYGGRFMDDDDDELAENFDDEIGLNEDKRTGSRRKPVQKKTRPNPAAKIEIEYENEPQTTTS